MAYNSTEGIPLVQPGGPTFSQRLWSEEVAIAQAQAGQPVDTREVAYQFSNGATFYDPATV